MTGKDCIQRTNIYITTQKGRQKMDYSQNTGLPNKSKEHLKAKYKDTKTTREILSILLESMIETGETNKYLQVLDTYLIISDIEQKLAKEIYGV